MRYSQGFHHEGTSRKQSATVSIVVSAKIHPKRREDKRHEKSKVWEVANKSGVRVEKNGSLD